MKIQAYFWTALISLLAISVSNSAFFSESLGPSNSSLKLYINFSAVNRTAVTDFSSFGNNGTFAGGTFNDGVVNGASWNASGKYGSALSFDGVDDYASIKNNSMVFERDNPFAVTAWIYSYGSDNTQGIVTKIDGNSPFAGWGLIIFSGQENTLNFALVNTNNANEIKVNSTIPVPKNEWVHVAATYDGSSNAGGATLYINGINRTAVFKNTLSGSIYNNIQESIGSYGGQNRFFNGSIDNVRIFNRSLTGEEINQTMLSERPPAISGLLSSWDFDEASGSRVYDENNIRWTPYSKGMYFSGLNYSLSFSAASFNESNGSMSLWMNPINTTFPAEQILLGNPSITSGLAGWWPMNGSADDQSGNGNHGVAQNSPLWNASGRFGYGVTLSAVETQSVQLPQFMPANGYSFSFWTKINPAISNSRGFMISATNNDSGGWIAYGAGKGGQGCGAGFGLEDFVFTVQQKGQNQFPCWGVQGILNNSNWHHIVVVRNATIGTVNDVVFYIDGVFRNATNYTASGYTSGFTQTYNTAFNTSINGRNRVTGPDTLMNFTIDDVRFYNRALGGAEALALNNTGAGLRLQAGELIFDTGDSYIDYNITAWSGWHHVVAAYNDTGALMFADGIEINRTNNRSSFVFPSESYAGGMPSSGFNGTIDEARIYSAMLTESEIKQLYSCAFPMAPSRIWDVTGTCNVVSENLLNSGINLTIRRNGNLTLSSTNLTVNRTAIESGSRIAIDVLSSLINMKQA
ncbi:MAG: laminin G domain-containing protein [Candidatus Aenigmarchaeota archaeon]|nr:laminin G domain-containing protein [Candidatus Aenigmarchaeota archaeon]